MIKDINVYCHNGVTISNVGSIKSKKNNNINDLFEKAKRLTDYEHFTSVHLYHYPDKTDLHLHVDIKRAIEL